MPGSASDVQNHVSQRIEAVRTAFRGHVDTTMDAVKTIASGKGVNDLLGIKPVQAAADILKDVTDGVVGKLVQGNIDVTLGHLDTQAQITRQGRVS